MSITEGTFELEPYVTIEYTVEWSEYIPATFHEPEEGGIDGCSYDIVIKSESMIEHMAILGDLAANYTEAAIESAVMAHFEDQD